MSNSGQTCRLAFPEMCYFLSMATISGPVKTTSAIPILLGSLGGWTVAVVLALGMLSEVPRAASGMCS